MSPCESLHAQVFIRICLSELVKCWFCLFDCAQLILHQDDQTAAVREIAVLRTTLKPHQHHNTIVLRAFKGVPQFCPVYTERRQSLIQTMYLFPVFMTVCRKTFCLLLLFNVNKIKMTWMTGKKLKENPVPGKVKLEKEI